LRILQNSPYKTIGWMRYGLERCVLCARSDEEKAWLNLHIIEQMQVLAAQSLHV